MTYLTFKLNELRTTSPPPLKIIAIHRTKKPISGPTEVIQGGGEFWETVSTLLNVAGMFTSLRDTDNKHSPIIIIR